MSPQEALSIAYQAARLAPLSGDNHDKVKQAFVVLQEALKPKEEKKK